MFQKKLIYGLVGLSIILVFSNIIVENVTSPEPEEIKSEDYITEIDSMFFEGLDRFGLMPEWITLKSIKNNKFDSLEYVYSIQTPADLTIASIVKELHSVFDNTNSTFYSDELKNHKKCVIKIESGNKLKLQAYFESNKELIRIMPHLNFIVNFAQELDVEIIEKLSQLLIPLTIVVTPSVENLGQLNKLNDYDFKYAVYISDKIDDDRFKLSGITEKSKIKSIIEDYKKSFKKARYFITDVNCRMYNSTVYNFIQTEFASQGISLIKNNSFLQLEMDDVKEAISMFRYYTSERDIIKQKQFLVSPKNMLYLRDEIDRQKKQGAKIF